MVQVVRFSSILTKPADSILRGFCFQQRWTTYEPFKASDVVFWSDARKSQKVLSQGDHSQRAFSDTYLPLKFANGKPIFVLVPRAQNITTNRVAIGNMI